MNKQELLRLLEEAVPPLRGKLQVERVLYKKSINKAYMSYLSEVLVTERDFLTLEKKLRSLLPGVDIALRIASPSLGEDFLRNIGQYKPVLTDFLRRQSPALTTWIHDVGWEVEQGRVLLTCPDEISVAYFKRHQLDEKLSQAIWDIFRLRLSVGLLICGQREEWVNGMRRQRGFSFSPELSPPPEPEGEAAPWEEPPGPPAQAPAQAAAPSCVRKNAAAPSPKPSKESKGLVLKGRAIADPPVPIAELADDSGIVVIEGILTGAGAPGVGGRRCLLLAL